MTKIKKTSMRKTILILLMLSLIIFSVIVISIYLNKQPPQESMTLSVNGNNYTITCNVLQKADHDIIGSSNDGISFGGEC